MASPPRLPKQARGPPANYTPHNPNAATSAPSGRYYPTPQNDDEESQLGPAGGGGPISQQSQDKLASVNARVEDVKSSLHKNIELAITRGEKIDDIHDKSEQLAIDADQFQKSAKKVRRMFWKRYWKMILLALLGLAIIIIIIVVVSKSNSSS